MSTWTITESDGDIVLECEGDSPRVIVRPRTRWDQGPLGLTTEAAREEARLLAADLALVLAGDTGRRLALIAELLGAESIDALETVAREVMRELERRGRRIETLQDARRQAVQLLGGRP